MTLTPVPVSTLWPPNAILMAGLTLTPIRSWALVLGAVFVAHVAIQFYSGVPAGMVLSWYVSNCTEALIGAGLLRRFADATPPFESFRSTVVFFAGAGLAAPFLSSFLDAGFVALNAWGDSGYWTVWRQRFFSNVLAAMTLVPVILTTVHRLTQPAPLPRRSLREASLGFAVLVGICWLVFVRQRPEPGISPALLYTPLPLLVGAAIRFGPWGASVAMLTCALVAIWGAVLGQGPFVASSALDNALSIQLFLIAAWIPVMSLASVVRERARADANARESEEQLAAAIEAAQLGRWEWDIAAQRLMWSDITRRIYEVPADIPVTPAVFDVLVHPDDRPLVAEATAAGLAGRGVDVEFRIRMADGREKWILSKGRTVLGADGRPARLVGIKVDITARKRADLQVQEERRQLAHQARVSVAGELSLTLAHEMNQPLAAILTNASAARRFLLRDPPDLRELSDIVEAIAQDNRRAAAIIRRFGMLLTTREVRRTLVGLNEVAAGVLDVTRADIISRGVSVIRQFGDGLPPVLGDPIQLQQLLMNLIVNACDAMESRPPEARRLILTTACEGAGGVRLTVADSGVGISSDHLERVFEPFVTTKPQRLGLGLAICRSIVTAHEGRLWVESGRRGGATFVLVLPAAPTAEIALAAGLDADRNRG